MKRSVTSKALRRFGFWQTIRGALIVALLGGFMMGSYGTIIAKTYPSQQSRDQLVQMLKSTPAVNFLAGEVKNAGTPASYAIYKSLPMMTLLISIWGMMVTTRLLRGNEEDGRTELLASARVTKGQVAMQLLIGFGYSLVIAVGIMWAIVAALGMLPDVNLSVLAALYMTLACFLPGLVFAALGIATSQLTLTRSQAVMYGLVPLLVLYCIRGAANTSDKLDWLKKVSPFGWSDLLDPVLNPQVAWILPPLIVAGVITVVGLIWAARRDYGTSLLGQSGEVTSHFYLLGSDMAFAIRTKRWTFFWWLVGTLSFVAFMAALAGMVSDLLRDSSGALGAIATVPPNQIKLLFIGSTFMILGVILLVFTIMQLGSARRDEAKYYLDNILVQPVKRSSWLGVRLAVLMCSALVIIVTSMITVWIIANTQGVTLSFSEVARSGIGVAVGVFFLLCAGVFFYGVWPRVMIAAMSAIVAWTFVIDIIRNLLDIDDWIEKTSILHYVPVDPTKSPEWSGALWLSCIGIVLLAVGIKCFTKRDIEGE